MSKRFGKYRVPNCECTERFTCRPCLDAAVARNLADARAQAPHQNHRQPKEST